MDIFNAVKEMRKGNVITLNGYVAFGFNGKYAITYYMSNDKHYEVRWKSYSDGLFNINSILSNDWKIVDGMKVDWKEDCPLTTNDRNKGLMNIVDAINYVKSNKVIVGCKFNGKWDKLLGIPSSSSYFNTNLDSPYDVWSVEDIESSDWMIVK